MFPLSSRPSLNLCVPMSHISPLCLVVPLLDGFCAGGLTFGFGLNGDDLRIVPVVGRSRREPPTPLDVLPLAIVSLRSSGFTKDVTNDD